MSDISAPTPTGEPVAVTGQHFVMYLTDDLPAARSFYESLFCLRPSASNSAYFVEYELPDGSAFALAHNPRAARVPTGGVMFGVPDAEAAIGRVEALGGKLIDRYGGAVCTSGWCMDPQGNAFGVHERKVREPA